MTLQVLSFLFLLLFLVERIITIIFLCQFFRIKFEKLLEVQKLFRNAYSAAVAPRSWRWCSVGPKTNWKVSSWNSSRRCVSRRVSLFSLFSHNTVLGDLVRVVRCFDHIWTFRLRLGEGRDESWR
jgi:hypothetical protein